MLFKVNDEKMGLQEVLDYIEAETDQEELFDEMLQECYGDVNICGLEYNQADIFERVDPIAYRCGVSDYFDSLLSDVRYELERMSEGDVEEFFDIELECISEEEI